ncbi:hypothetical protein SD78_3106 [Bacillus badius]|nr:hypothetical protein SD78_3106 [Bacillus badius]
MFILYLLLFYILLQLVDTSIEPFTPADIAHVCNQTVYMLDYLLF